MLNGYEKTFSLFGGQMEEILVIIYFLSSYLLYQQRTEGIDSFILKWTNPTPAPTPDAEHARSSLARCRVTTTLARGDNSTGAGDDGTTAGTTALVRVTTAPVRGDDGPGVG